ncbi:hypothetical protein HOLleu_03519 [Holothuria leucospilota]|uniref:Uncharacterized protein n=1 Tax=Holothuria leucospilota TaxID=206669 RepID=A0A9Q1HHN4_HOLLE|nr:hypothetical protein HOLleu_03519 [Holothuria leucospilota]
MGGKKREILLPNHASIIFMYIIVGVDPTLTPLYRWDSEGNVTTQDESIEASTALSSDDESFPPEPPGKTVKSRNRDEMRDILVESQQNLEETLITIHKKRTVATPY